MSTDKKFRDDKKSSQSRQGKEDDVLKVVYEHCFQVKSVLAWILMAVKVVYLNERKLNRKICVLHHDSL